MIYEQREMSLQISNIPQLPNLLPTSLFLLPPPSKDNHHLPSSRIIHPTEASTRFQQQTPCQDSERQCWGIKVNCQHMLLHIKMGFQDYVHGCSVMLVLQPSAQNTQA